MSVNVKISSNIILVLFFLVIMSTNQLAQRNPYENQLRLAKSFEERGELEEAENIYSELHNTQPQNFQFYQLLYKVLVSQKKYNNAIELVKRQLSISKNKVVLYGDLGSVYYLNGDEKMAFDAWNDALELEPENPFAYRNIANYLIENRLIEKAIDVLKKGNELADDKTLFSYDIANLYSITMKYEEATREYCRILAQKPTQINTIKNMMLSYINANQAAGPTIKTVEEIYQEEGSTFYLQLLSELYLKIGENSKALEAIKKYESETTRNGSAIFVFAQQIARYGDYKTAAEAYNSIISNYPKSALYARAEIGYTQSLEADLNNNASNEQSWKPFIINSNVNISEYKKLLKSYQNLSTKYPTSMVGWRAEFRSAIVYFEKLNNLKRADSILNKISSEANTPQITVESDFELAKIAIQQNNLGLAENRLLKIIDRKISNVNIISSAKFLLAKIKMWQGKFTESIELYKSVMENKKDDFVNDALEYSLIINTFKSDSTNLFSFVNADYLVERKKYNEAIKKFKGLAQNKSLFLLNNFSGLKYVELLIALNKYEEASIFLEEVSNCDEANIYKDRFLYLLGSNYYYGLNNGNKALVPLKRVIEEFPNSIYSSKAREIIYEINEGVDNTL